MAATKPEMKPTGKQLAQHAEDATKRALVEAPGAADAARARKLRKPPTLMGKLQSVLPALMLWKMHIAAANDQLTLNKWLRKVLTKALRDYDYPTIPLALKAAAEAEQQSSQAA
jgi:hypothetical protein